MAVVHGRKERNTLTCDVSVGVLLMAEHCKVSK